MRAKTLQIVWHTKEPVFSLDFHPSGVLATGGGDREVKLWELCAERDGSPGVRYLRSLEGHSRTINCVRFSRNGNCLASAGDSGEVILWRPAATLPGAAVAQPSTPSTHRATAAATAATTPTSAVQHSEPGSRVDEAGTATPVAAPTAHEDSAALWRQAANLRGHHDDVTDICWSHDDAVLLTGSVENEAMMFDADRRGCLARLVGHRHYVQGVAWDPLGSWLVTVSADRTVRVHGLKPPPTGSKGALATAPKASTALAREYVHSHTLSKRQLPLPPTTPLRDHAPGVSETPVQASPQDAVAGSDASTEHHQLPAVGTAAAIAEQQQQEAQQQQQQNQQAGAAAPTKPLAVPLFLDEALPSFFRRPAWSPCGALLALPAGISPHISAGSGGGGGAAHATYLYARGQWSSPLAALPCPSKASTVTRFCPVIFRCRHEHDAPGSGAGSGATTHSSTSGGRGVGLPYRLLLAVATLDSVLLYDTETLEPLLLCGPLHYAPITDLAWSHDGGCLAVSSHDGYCSLLTFQPGELGTPLPQSELPAGLVSALERASAALPCASPATAAPGTTPSPCARSLTAAAAAAAATAAAAVTDKEGGSDIVRPVPSESQAPPVSQPEQQQQQSQLAQPSFAVAAAAPAATTTTVTTTAAAAAVTTVTTTTPTAGAAVIAAPSSAPSQQPRRIAPLPVLAGPVPTVATAAPAAVSAAAPPAAATVPPPRRVTPTPIAAAVPPPCAVRRVVPTPITAAGAAASTACVQEPAAVAVVSPPVAAAATATAAAAAAAAPDSGRVGLTAVAAALAAAKAKARRPTPPQDAARSSDTTNKRLRLND